VSVRVVTAPRAGNKIRHLVYLMVSISHLFPSIPVMGKVQLTYTLDAFSNNTVVTGIIGFLLPTT
jgi:hypothetical protein